MELEIMLSILVGLIGLGNAYFWFLKRNYQKNVYVQAQALEAAIDDLETSTAQINNDISYIRKSLLELVKPKSSKNPKSKRVKIIEKYLKN